MTQSAGAVINMSHQAGLPAMLTAWPAPPVLHGCSRPCRCTLLHPPDWCWTDAACSTWMSYSAMPARRRKRHDFIFTVRRADVSRTITACEFVLCAYRQRPEAGWRSRHTGLRLQPLHLGGHRAVDFTHELGLTTHHGCGVFWVTWHYERPGHPKI